VAAPFPGRKQGVRISFASEEVLWRTLTPKRWALLKEMTRSLLSASLIDLAGC
jgi:hypothetical protein